jgi:hypothetical protein
MKLELRSKARKVVTAINIYFGKFLVSRKSYDTAIAILQDRNKKEREEADLHIRGLNCMNEELKTDIAELKDREKIYQDKICEKLNHVVVEAGHMQYGDRISFSMQIDSGYLTQFAFGPSPHCDRKMTEIIIDSWLRQIKDQLMNMHVIEKVSYRQLPVMQRFSLGKNPYVEEI